MCELDKLIKVNLDKERHMRLTLKGMIGFQKLTNKNLLKGFKFEELALEDIAALMWACLIHEDRELKYDDVLCMIDMGNIIAVSEAVANCILQSFPDKENVSPLAEKSPDG